MGIKPKDKKYSGSGDRVGFTLVEVLVVVALLALLSSILLPSLSKARSQARSTICLSTLGQIGRAELMYQMDNKGWIPGSPLTTGRYFLDNFDEDPEWDTKLPGFNRFVVEWFDFTTPLRALMYDLDSIPEDRKELMKTVTEKPFACPANPHILRPWSSEKDLDDGWPTIRAPSYLTMATIMRGGPNIYEKYNKARKAGETSLLAGWIAQSDADDWAMHLPANYVPRHSRLGAESRKVFVADGLRFYDKNGALEIMDYTIHPYEPKGMVNATPPSTYEPKAVDNSYYRRNHREYTLARKKSYRHGDNNRINVGFFDGHAKSLLVKPGKKRFTGSAVDPEYYYPTGTVVHDPDKLHDDTILKGTKLD